MAALADLSGAGRHLIREITAELGRNGLLEPGEHFETMDELLAGLERFSERAANAVNTPPLDVPALRAEWEALRTDAVLLPRPAIDSLEALWSDLKRESEVQRRSVFALSSLMALSALAALPERVRWLSKGTAIAARRTGGLVGEALLGHYRQALGAIHEAGFLRYWIREYSPYLRAAATQFNPKRKSLTERLLRR